MISLHELLDCFYKAHKEKVHSFIFPTLLSQIKAKKPGYPMLKTKEAETRHWCEFAATLANLMRDVYPLKFKAGPRSNHPVAGKEPNMSGRRLKW